MKIKVYGYLTNDRKILSHVFMNCVPNDMLTEIIHGNSEKTREEVEATEVDLELRINGQVVDIEPFFTNLFEQYTELVEKEAIKIVTEKTSDKLQEIANQIQEQKEIVESWANQINWQVENPFIKND